MTLRPLSFFLATLFCTIHCNAFAGDDDEIATDRPDFVESSKVVGKGRLQLETSLQWDRQRDDQQHTRTLTTPTLLRIGMGESAELRFETEGRTVEHASDPSTGEKSVTAGYADLEVGVKWHLADQQGSHPSMAVLAHAELPSGSRALRGHGVRPSLRLAAEWELKDGWSLGVMPGLGIDSNDNGARYGYGILAATLGKEINDKLHGFVEVAAGQIARASNGGSQLSLDTGLAYALGKDMQVDALLMHGLNHRTPDLSVGVGFSIRR
jgi:hypothetical protein